MAAGTAAAMGLRTALVEDPREIGTPRDCSGKLQLHAFREFNLPERLILNTLQAGAFYAPNGAVARVRRAVPDSHVVDRAVFDRWLVDQAQERGAELLLDTRLRTAERDNGAVRVTGERSGKAFSATAALIVDAEGARPVLPKALGFQLRRRLILGLQYQMTDVDLEEPDCPEVYLGTAAAPGFFAWLMPLGDRHARVGVCVDPQLAGRAPLHYLESLLHGHPVVSRRLRCAPIAADERLRATIERLGDTAYQSRLLAPFMTHALRPSHLATLARPMLKIIRYGLRALWDDEIPAEENGADEMNP